MTMDELRRAIHKTWGFDSLRPLQEEAMQATLAGRDTLLVLPTGGGKSLTFQAPALVRTGTTLVLSPLISLMQDQVDGLQQNGVRAAALHSGLESEEARQTYGRFRRGELDLLYLAPERLFLPSFLETVRDVGPAAIVIDEAHCISHWGHDFRPEYRRFHELRPLFPGVPIQACTATATPRVQEDIATQLRLEDPAVFVGSFDRPNLTYRFLPRSQRIEQIVRLLHRHRGEAGIIYALRRADVDDITRSLCERGFHALPYHAGLADDVRRDNQEAFLRERCNLIVATVAFGMGIDRPDVRYVLHAAMPKSMEHYLQESGRAGRDGQPAECILLYSGADYQGWKSITQNGDENADREPALRRLGDMYAFAAGSLCRHRSLVAYFGQELESENCEACDVCLGEIPALPQSTTVAQKILSCVYRVRERFGAVHVCDVLRGKKTERIERFAHDKLSTFGLLHDMDVSTLRGAMDQLVAQGLLHVETEPYPTISLTRDSWPVLKAEREVKLLEPPRPPKRTTKAKTTRQAH
ncbi:MAG: RecQ family ATP-dependent DNA helicase, partial [Planctomycetes bacterium]|nr:RecQ family ATP-dependent DNA helicase [Planctomycetota bacterium]